MLGYRVGLILFIFENINDKCMLDEKEAGWTGRATLGSAAYIYIPPPPPAAAADTKERKRASDE